MDAGASRPWAELTADLLHEIADCLRDNVADYIRFHAVCKPWRAVAPPPERMPRFSPCLLVPYTLYDYLAAAIHFYSPFSRTSCYLPHAAVLRGRTPERVIDPTGGRILTAGVSDDDSTASLVNLLTGDITALPPFPHTLRDRRARRCSTACTVLTNGAVVVHTVAMDFPSRFSRTVILEPGHGGGGGRELSWKDVDLDMAMAYPTSDERHDKRLAMAMCAYGGTLSGGPCAMAAKMPPVNPADIYRRRYVFEFQGELLCADVVMANGVRVTVHALDTAADAGKEPRWVERPHGCCDNEHVCMFLGDCSSFAMDARELGGGGKVIGGGAYFVQHHHVKPKSGLYRYSFKDRKTTMVDELPDAASRSGLMWFMPRPRISPVSTAPCPSAASKNNLL